MSIESILLLLILFIAIIWLFLHNRHLISENKHLERRAEYWQEIARQFVEDPEDPDEKESWRQ